MTKNEIANAAFELQKKLVEMIESRIIEIWTTDACPKEWMDQTPSGWLDHAHIYADEMARKYLASDKHWASIRLSLKTLDQWIIKQLTACETYKQFAATGQP